MSALAAERPDPSVIPWASPVLSFGDSQNSLVATLGLNPSNREFVDNDGNELKDGKRRFPTLNSLGVESWGNLSRSECQTILNSFTSYFQANPYDRWFRVLDDLISDTGFSYYDPANTACHLDLVPYATHKKWGTLSGKLRNSLAEESAESLGALLANSKVKLLILNGQSVVELFQRLSGCNLGKTHMTDWNLPRKSGNCILGFAYRGTVDSFATIRLKTSVQVVGFNHNIQSSFGVTNYVKNAIRSWLGDIAMGCLHEPS